MSKFLHAHPADPETQHEAADRFGKLVAQGIITASECITSLVGVALDGGYSGDIGGLQSRLHWTLSDSERAWHEIRSRADWQVRKRVRSLADQRRPAAELLDGAYATNADLGQPFLQHEVYAIAREELATWMRIQSRKRRDA